RRRQLEGVWLNGAKLHGEGETAEAVGTRDVVDAVVMEGPDAASFANPACIRPLRTATAQRVVRLKRLVD
ncbi:MAG: hypothetical protein R6V19_00180, partial [Armatimonadota bacterium]